MKLIATLATLAALVGQTEAATTALVTTSVKVGNGPCKDEVTITATLGGPTTDNSLVKLSFKKLTTKGTNLATLIDNAETTCAAGKNTGYFDAASVAVASDITTISLTATATACATSLAVVLKDVCNNGITDYSGVFISLNIDNVANDAGTLFPSAQAADTTKIDALASFEVTKLPVGKSETGEFTATFTGVATLNGNKLVLSLPEGYSVPIGAKCSIKTATGAAFYVSGATGSEALTAKCDTPCVFSTAIPATGQTGAVDTSKLTFTCDKVTAGATVPAPATADVSIKAHATSNTNLFAGYAKSKSASPTKSPTKAADSPASVATASGVVVGALGVAALFLA